MQLDDTAHILGSAEFFAICSLEQRRMLAFASEWIKLRAGDTLFKAGQVSPGAYVLISGELSSTQKLSPNSNPIEIIQPGTVIGELALIVKHPRRSTIVCKSDAQLLMVPRSAFSKLMQQFPEIAVKAVDQIKGDVGKYVSSIKAVGGISSQKN